MGKRLLHSSRQLHNHSQCKYYYTRCNIYIMLVTRYKGLTIELLLTAQVAILWAQGHNCSCSWHILGVCWIDEALPDTGHGDELMPALWQSEPWGCAMFQPLLCFRRPASLRLRAACCWEVRAGLCQVQTNYLCNPEQTSKLHLVNWGPCTHLMVC